MYGNKERVANYRISRAGGLLRIHLRYLSHDFEYFEDRL